MTSVTSSSNGRHAAPPCAALPHRSDFLFRWFAWYVRRYLRQHFQALRLARGCRPSIPPDVPLLIVLNHPSWWDPLICVVLAELFPERVPYAPMEAAALARYSLFNKLGFYGLEPGTARGAAAFLRTTTAILAQPRTAVWLTAQGRFCDARVRPPGLRPGVGHLVRRLPGAVVLTLALEYPFWDERLPQALARFGTPIRIDDGLAHSPAEWTACIEANLTAAQDALAAAALTRAPAEFETLLTGRVGVGGLYDGWRRCLAWLRGERFHAEHGSGKEGP